MSATLGINCGGMSSTQSGCCIGSDSIDGFGFLSLQSFRPIAKLII